MSCRSFGKLPGRPTLVERSVAAATERGFEQVAHRVDVGIAYGMGRRSTSRRCCWLPPPLFCAHCRAGAIGLPQTLPVLDDVNIL